MRRHGSGTYVRSDQTEIDLLSLGGTIAAFHTKGISVATRILNPTALIQVDSDTDNPFASQQAYFLTRLSQVDKGPVLLEHIYLHPTLFAGIDALNLTDQSLSQVVEKRYYLRPTNGRQTFRITYLCARLLSEQAPLALVSEQLALEPLQLMFDLSPNV